MWQLHIFVVSFLKCTLGPQGYWRSPKWVIFKEIHFWDIVDNQIGQKILNWFVETSRDRSMPGRMYLHNLSGAHTYTKFNRHPSLANTFLTFIYFLSYNYVYLEPVFIVNIHSVPTILKRTLGAWKFPHQFFRKAKFVCSDCTQIFFFHPSLVFKNWQN